MSKKVLIIDDSSYMRTTIKNILEKEGFDIVGIAPNGEIAIDLAIQLNPDLITLDNILPDMTGLDILKIIKEQGLKSKVIMISAVGQQSVIEEGFDLGASEYIVKPFEPEDLMKIVNKIIKE